METQTEEPKRRIAETIQDVAMLFSDMQVELQLVEGNAIYINFPRLPDETTRTPDPMYNYEHLKENDPIRFSRQVRQAIRCLVGPRFMRLTGTADHIYSYFAFHNGKTDYPNTKVVKRDTPLTIQFDSQKKCEKFWREIKKLSKESYFHKKIKN